MKPKLISITTVPQTLELLLIDQLTFMSGSYRITAVSSDVERLRKTVKRDEIEVSGVEMSRKITPLKDLKALWRMYRFLRKEKPLIVQTYSPKAGIVGMMAAWMAGVPIRMHSVIGLPLLIVTGTKRRLLNIVERITYGCATRVYPNSHNLRTIMAQEKLCRLNKMTVIGNGSSDGIESSRFDATLFSQEQKCELREKLNIGREDFVFIFIGRLVSDKGINELVDAFVRIADKYPQARLLLVGTPEDELDPLRDDTKAILESDKRIVLAGFQSDVRPYLAISDAFVFPSYREGFPSVVMEAGAMGLPSIVTNINGCNEIIIEGENGMIIPVKDVDALEGSMEKMLVDGETRERLKRNARELITSRYERQSLWDGILAEYRRLEQECNSKKRR